MKTKIEPVLTAMLASLAGVGSVSYTHLDVYKRQVLVCAFAAVGVALCFFWKPAAWLQIWYWFLARPYMFAVFAAVTVLSVVYIIAGPLKIRDFLHRKRAKHKENT